MAGHNYTKTIVCVSLIFAMAAIVRSCHHEEISREQEKTKRALIESAETPEERKALAEIIYGNNAPVTPANE